MNPKDESKASEKTVSRRYFLETVGALAIGTSVVGTCALSARFLEPNVLFEPRTTFNVGVPDEYAVDSVTFDRKHRVYVVRESSGFYAMSAICTHFGCVTRWDESEGLITCPCHGSRFTPRGDVIDGPAPRALPRLEIQMGKEELVVDTEKVVDRDRMLKV